MVQASSSTFLRPIPEDRSDASSALEFRLPQSGRNRPLSVVSDANSSTATNLENSPARSVVSTSSAVLVGHGHEDDSPGEAGVQPKRLNACQTFWTRRRVYLVLAGLALATGVIVSIVYVGELADRPTTPAVEAGTVPPQPSASPPSPTDSAGTIFATPQTLAPVAAPIATKPPIVADMVTQLDTFLSLIVDNPDDLTVNTDTPQYMARSFLLNEDFLFDDILAEGAWRVHQRFVAAQLHYALDGTNWVNGSATEMYLLPTLSECRWYGISCSPNSRNELAIVRIQLAGNQLSGTLFHELSALSSLQELDLGNNEIGGTIPSGWFSSDDNSSINWPDLFWFDLSQNNLDGFIPAGLWHLPILRFVYLNSNSLMGRLDDDDDDTPATAVMTKLLRESLDHVWLSDNQLTGPLPPWLHASTAPRLLQFLAGNNQLTGQLPVDLPGNLTRLDLASNQLSGPLPENLWSSLPELQYLYLDHNRLTGSIPADYRFVDNNTTIIKIQEVWLTDNVLTGAIPDGFGQNWPNLMRLHLDMNDGLTGVLGPLQSFRCISQWKYLDSLKANCTAVTCVCCNNCTA